MVWRVTPQWMPSCWAAACILLATPFNERPCRWRASETSCARGRCSIGKPNERCPGTGGNLLESYSAINAAQRGQIVVTLAAEVRKENRVRHSEPCGPPHRAELRPYVVAAGVARTTMCTRNSTMKSRQTCPGVQMGRAPRRDGGLTRLLCN